jgi:hypothetical protein
LLAHTALWLLLPAGIHGQSRCVQVKQDGSVWRTMPAFIGSEIRLRFDHSIYGSRVEEVFRLGPEAFHLTALRYAEPRLVDFYGHDRAVYENGAWVVRPRSAPISSLGLRTSSDVPMSLVVEQEQRSIDLVILANSVVHLTIASCKGAYNG